MPTQGSHRVQGGDPTFVLEAVSSSVCIWVNKIVADCCGAVHRQWLDPPLAVGDESMRSSFWVSLASPSWWRLARSAGGDVVVAAGPAARRGEGGGLVLPFLRAVHHRGLRPCAHATAVDVPVILQRQGVEVLRVQLIMVLHVLVIMQRRVRRCTCAVDHGG